MKDMLIRDKKNGKNVTMMKKTKNQKQKNHTAQDTQSGENYALYTEKIEPRLTVKYHKWFRLLEIIVSGILFGAMASIVMVLCTPTLYENIRQREDERAALVIERDEYPQDAADDENETVEIESTTASDKLEENLQLEKSGVELIQTEDVVSFTQALQKIVESVKKSTLVVDIYRKDMEDFIQDSKSSTQTVGVFVGTVQNTDTEYIMLTSYEAVQNSDSIVVQFGSSTEVEAQVIGKDEQTGIALFSVKESAIPVVERARLSSAKLGNSYNVKSGDIIVAVGRIGGKNESVDYGTITRVITHSGLDNSYDIFDMGFDSEEGDFACIFNSQGSLIGLASYQPGISGMTALGISDVKGVIEALSGGKGITYMGIHGQNVTGSIATRYDLPIGIYVTQVEVESPAYEAGIQPGDVIVGLDENMVLTIQAFSEKLYKYDDKQQVIVKVKRQGKEGYKDLEFPVNVRVR